MYCDWQTMYGQKKFGQFLMVFCIILGLLNIALGLNTQLFTYMDGLICITKDALLQVL
jgi:hypothetical protein